MYIYTMQLRFLLFLFIASSIFMQAAAQVTQPLIKQQFTVVQTQQNNTSLQIASEQMLMRSDRITITHYGVQSINSKGYRLQAITTHISGKLIAFGQEQNFNSNDTTGLNKEALGWIKNLLNKPVDILVVNNHALPILDTTAALINFLEEDAGKYFLPITPNNFKQGYSWSDSTAHDSSKTVYQYLVSKTTPDSIEISVYTDLIMHKRMQEKERFVVQHLKGVSRAVRWYNTHTGLLKKEESNTLLSGSMQTAEATIPVKISVKLLVEVKEGER